MKVLMFIKLVSGVKYPKISTVGFLKRPFVDVLSSCRSFFALFYLFYLFCVAILFNFFVSGILLLLSWRKVIQLESHRTFPLQLEFYPS